MAYTWAMSALWRRKVKYLENDRRIDLGLSIRWGLTHFVEGEDKIQLADILEKGI
jgi:hypothetical protein